MTQSSKTILLRTLTRKSKLGFGKLRDVTIQEMLDDRLFYGKLSLISPYYKLTTINYTDDILEELGITAKYRIEKPSANKDMYYRFLKENGYKRKLRTRDGANKMKSAWELNLGLSKTFLQSKNHGR